MTVMRDAVGGTRRLARDNERGRQRRSEEVENNSNDIIIRSRGTEEGRIYSLAARKRLLARHETETAVAQTPRNSVLLLSSPSAWELRST